MGFVAFKEIGKLESKLDVLSDAILNYSANENEPNVQFYEDTLEKRIAEMYIALQSLSNQFSVANINDHLERMMKESEGGGDKR